MRSVEDQQIKVTAAAVAPRPVRVAISEAQGLLCAEEVVSARALPAFDQAALDGYAARSEDVAGATPKEPVALAVVGESVAGASTPSAIGPGMALKVAAGAMLPTGADVVVPAVWTDQGAVRVAVHAGPPASSGRSAWRASDLREVLAREFGAHYSISGVYALLRRLGQASLVPRPQHPDADPSAQRAFVKKSAPHAGARAACAP